METIWGRALPILREQVGDRNYATWIEPIRGHVAPSAEVQLEVPSRFFQEWVTKYFLAAICEALTCVSGTPQRVRIVVRAEAAPPRSGKGPLPAARRPVGTTRKPAVGQLVPWYTFDTFVVGESNRVAHSAALSVARKPGREFNPLFLHGDVGLGKTHLINALGSEFLTRVRQRRLACLSAESFMNQLITCMRQDQMASFRERYRRLDMLILDDIQFLAGKERTQEEFLHTFNALHAEGKQIVLTCDKPPTEVAGLEQGLRSRFTGGLLADIQPPTPAMRIAILEKKAAAQEVKLPPEVARYLAENTGPTVRELEGVLKLLAAAASVGMEPVSLKLAQRVLPPAAVAVEIVPVGAVIERVGREFRVTVAELKSRHRAKALAYARQVAMYLCRALAGASYPAIAEEFGGRDHSTVMHAVRAVERKREADPATASLLARLEASLRGSRSEGGGSAGEGRHAVGEPER